jgi:hypothetical protein
MTRKPHEVITMEELHRRRGTTPEEHAAIRREAARLKAEIEASRPKLAVRLDRGTLWATLDEHPKVLASGDTIDELVDRLEEALVLVGDDPDRDVRGPVFAELARLVRARGCDPEMEALLRRLPPADRVAIEDRARTV